MTELRYMGSSISTKTFRGRESGRSYRFSSHRSNRIKPVEDRDVPYFLSLRIGSTGPLFEVVHQPSGDTMTGIVVNDLPVRDNLVDPGMWSIGELGEKLAGYNSTELGEVLMIEQSNKNRSGALHLIRGMLSANE